MDINRFTEKSREALATAQGLAAQYGHQEVDAEHLALALVNQEDGFVPRVLERAGVAPKALVTALEAVLKKRPSVRGPGAEMGTITISQRVAKAIANAEALAKRLRDEYVSVEHIFAELLREPASTGLGQVAADAGLSAEKFTETMMAVRGPHRVTSANPEESYEALSPPRDWTASTETARSSWKEMTSSPAPHSGHRASAIRSRRSGSGMP